MICTIIKKFTDKSVLEKAQMAELRIDTMIPPLDSIIEQVETCAIPLICTCRYSVVKDRLRSGINTKIFIEDAMKSLMDCHIDFIDIEHDMPIDIALSLIRYARNKNISVIRSYHAEETPSISGLLEIANNLVNNGADFVKIATKGKNQEDKDKIKQLYAKFERPERLIAFCTGKRFQSTRYASLKLGAPWIYACEENGKSNELGIPTRTQVFKRIYSKLSSDKQGFNNLTVYSSKSVIQREIIIAMLGTYPSKIEMYGNISTDIQSAVNIVNQLGGTASIVPVENSNPIKTNILVCGPKEFRPIHKLDVGESGFLARMMMAIIPAINKGESCIISGEGTLLKRTFDNEKKILKRFGIDITSWSSLDKVKMPIRVSGALKPGTFTIPKTESSQLISGLIIAESLMNESSNIVIEDSVSTPYIEMTLRALEGIGKCTLYKTFPVSETAIDKHSLSKAIEINIDYVSTNGRLPTKDWKSQSGGDWSGMMNFMILAAIASKLEVCTEYTDYRPMIHPDMKFINTYKYFNISEKINSIQIRKSICVGFDFDVTECPDSAMIISLFALMCNGISRISGVSRLCNKESNRLEAIIETIKGLGGYCKLINDDCLEIKGKSYERRLLTNALLNGGNFKSFNDHRIVMMLKIAECFADGPIHIDSISAIKKSYPTFIEDLKNIKHL